jgi:hypothetical protein
VIDPAPLVIVIPLPWVSVEREYPDPFPISTCPLVAPDPSIPVPPVFALNTTKKAVKNPEIIVQTKVNINKNAVNVYFGNLQKTSSLFYQLSYITNGKQEGAGGTITTKGKYSLSRNLIFGTCSAGVCRYHKKISNAKLNVTVTYLDGKTKTKTYGVRL